MISSSDACGIHGTIWWSSVAEVSCFGMLGESTQGRGATRRGDCRMRSKLFYLVAVALLGSLAYFGVRADYRSFVGSLFAAFVSVFIVLFLEMELRPQIGIFEEATPPRLPDGRRFLRVIVSNPALWWPLRLIADRRPLYQARASITFLTETNDPVFGSGRQMIGRWSNTPEPVHPISVSPTLAGTPGITFLWSLGATRDSVDIGSGACELLDVVMRVPNEDGCRGWHNRMIQRADTSPEDQFELPRARYRALVRVNSSGRSFKALFRIVCDVGITDFRLEPIRPVPRGL